MNSIYSNYFQKSRTFLYPFLKITKTKNYNVLQTYLSWEDIHYTDCKLIVTFKSDNTPEFKAFEKSLFLSNTLFENVFDCEDNIKAYIFDFSSYKEDWYNFLSGRYSLLNQKIKDSIKTYYGEFSNEWSYVRTYLYPNLFFETYAKLLSSPKDYDEMLMNLKNIGELCDKFNEDKEDCKLVKLNSKTL